MYVHVFQVLLILFCLIMHFPDEIVHEYQSLWLVRCYTLLNRLGVASKVILKRFQSKQEKINGAFD